MIQTWFREKSTSFKFDEGGLLDIGTQLKVILIVIESDSEPRGELLEVETWLLCFKVFGVIARYKVDRCDSKLIQHISSYSNLN